MKFLFKFVYFQSCYVHSILLWRVFALFQREMLQNCIRFVNLFYSHALFNFVFGAFFDLFNFCFFAEYCCYSVQVNISRWIKIKNFFPTSLSYFVLLNAKKPQKCYYLKQKKKEKRKLKIQWKKIKSKKKKKTKLIRPMVHMHIELEKGAHTHTWIATTYLMIKKIYMLKWNFLLPRYCGCCCCIFRILCALLLRYLCKCAMCKQFFVSSSLLFCFVCKCGCR